MPVEERDITIDELTNASEVFLSATTKRIIPIVKIDGRIVGNGKPGSITSTLYQKFVELEKSFAHLVSR